MIDWMSRQTSDIVDAYGIEVYGYDLERESEYATACVCFGEHSRIVSMGDVRGLANDAIDRRFRAAVLADAVMMDADETEDRESVAAYYSFADELLAA